MEINNIYDSSSPARAVYVSIHRTTQAKIALSTHIFKPMLDFIRSNTFQMRLKSLFWTSRVEIKHFVYPNPPNLNLFALLTSDKRLSPVTWSPTSAQPDQQTDAAVVQELI